MALDLFEDPDRGLLVNEVNYTMEFRNSIAPTSVNIPERMVDFCLKVASDGWNAANGWPEGTVPHVDGHLARRRRVGLSTVVNACRAARLTDSRYSAAIVGGSGYTGGELLRLLLGHPRIDVRAGHQRTARRPVRPLHASEPAAAGRR